MPVEATWHAFSRKVIFSAREVYANHALSARRLAVYLISTSGINLERMRGLNFGHVAEIVATIAPPIFSIA